VSGRWFDLLMPGKSRLFRLMLMLVAGSGGWLSHNYACNHPIVATVTSEIAGFLVAWLIWAWS
jgi:hypothetical protein